MKKMTKIKLSQGEICLIDEKDYNDVKAFKWRVNKAPRGVHVTSTMRNKNGRRTTISIHRFIMKVNKDEEVDHKDDNWLNNRRCNLRISINGKNRGKKRMQKSNTSGFKGVSFHKGKNKWVSRIGYKNKIISLGCFSSSIEAAKVYDNNAIKYFGEFARTNKILGLLD